MRNVTFVSTSSELAYLAYQSAAFNSPVPYLSQQATFARTDLGLTSYAVSGGGGQGRGGGDRQQHVGGVVGRAGVVLQGRGGGRGGGRAGGRAGGGAGGGGASSMWVGLVGCEG